MTRDAIRSWAEELGVDEQTLVDAIDLFGEDAKAVREAIGYLKIACSHLRANAPPGITLH